MREHLRDDVAGVAIFARSEFERRHLRDINQKMARMKLALHKLKWFEDGVRDTALAGLGEAP